MILFESDWDKYPDAIVHNATRNKTFVRFAMMLRDHGIKNHLFMLQLHDPALEFVDPRDPNISMENIVRITQEVAINPWYYFREIACVPGSELQEDIVRFIANRGNVATLWLFFNHITLYLIQIRQTGKSFTMDSLSVIITNCLASYTNIAMLTKDENLRSKTLARIKDIEASLPFYLKRRHPKEVFNTEEFVVSALNNTFKAYLPNKSPKAALNVARGSSNSVHLVDEGAFLYNIAITLPAYLATGTNAKPAAERRGNPWGMICGTTAGRIDDPDGKYIYNLLEDACVWTEALYDAEDLEDLKTMIFLNSPGRNHEVNVSLNHRQLGYTDEWLVARLAEAKATKEDAERDFGNRWTSGGLTSPIDPDTAGIIRASESKMTYDEVFRPQPYIIRWLMPVEKAHAYMKTHDIIVTSDTSDAVGGDDISLIFRCVRTGKVIGAGNYNKTNLINFAEFLVNILERFDRTTMLIERRSSGATIIDYMLLMLPARGIDPFARMYNTVVQNARENPEDFALISKAGPKKDSTYEKFKKCFGFATSGSGATSRSMLYGEVFTDAIEMCGTLIGDKKTIDQLLALTVIGGRVDHLPGFHDDLVIAWLLSHWFLTKGRNLEFYGISHRDILADNEFLLKEKEVKNSPEHRQAEEIKWQIEDLLHELENERSPALAELIEARIERLNDKLPAEVQRTLSVAELMDKIKNTKTKAKDSYLRYRMR